MLKDPAAVFAHCSEGVLLDLPMRGLEVDHAKANVLYMQMLIELWR